MEYRFFVHMDGSVFGPYSAKKMLELELLDDILVTEESINGHWLPAKEFDFYDMSLKESGTIINDDGSIRRRIVQPTPQDLSKWNWGAFWFTWLWAICNGIYWPLVSIPIYYIPYIGPIVFLGIGIYLGIKGTEIAWNAKTWPSWESFKKTQHKWAVAILWVLGISIALVAVTIAIVAIVAS